MTIPPHVESKRGIQLRRIQAQASLSEMMAWPHITEGDAVHIANIITDFSHIDMVMRMLIWSIDRFDQSHLEVKWHRNTSKMRIGDVEKSLKNSQCFDPEGVERSTTSLISGQCEIW